MLAELDGEPVLVARGPVPRRVVPSRADRRHARPRALPGSRPRGAACRGIASGRRSSTRRARPTPSAASSSPSSRARSSSPRGRAGGPGRQPRARRTRSRRRATYSMPKDNIERAIARGAGTDADAEAYEHDHLRGLRPERRRAARRGADGQPQPHGRRGAAHLRQERRQPRRVGLGRVALRAQGVVLVPTARASTRTS